jgi:hypothetical protein
MPWLFIPPGVAIPLLPESVLSLEVLPGLFPALAPEPIPVEGLPPAEPLLALEPLPVPSVMPRLLVEPGPLTEPGALLPELAVVSAGVRFDGPLPELPQAEIIAAAPTAKHDDARREPVALRFPRSRSMASPALVQRPTPIVAVDGGRGVASVWYG